MTVNAYKKLNTIFDKERAEADRAKSVDWGNRSANHGCGVDGGENSRYRSGE
ncbi:hypothetical protein GCM10007290_33090 [Providencia stuartii]|nr:hypothetical protein GCM10007290_33090 [Providencia thailandensis]